MLVIPIPVNRYLTPLLEAARFSGYIGLLLFKLTVIRARARARARVRCSNSWCRFWAASWFRAKRISAFACSVPAILTLQNSG